MKRISTLLIYCISGLFLLFLAMCQSNRPTNADVVEQAVDKADITNPANGYYKLSADLNLPVVTQIPNYKNNDTLIAFLQGKADTFSWRTFIAINWPANENGMPDTTKYFGQKANFTVFEHWMPSTNIYVNPGETPKDWNYGLMDNKYPSNSGAVTSFRIIPKFESIDKTSADNLPVVDVHGKYTLFEIFYNKQAYDYVTQGKLYSKEGQQEFVKTWPSLTKGLKVTDKGKPIGIEETYKRAYFSVGTTVDSTIVQGDRTYYFTHNTGTVILKTGWKLFAPTDDKSRYFTRKVTIKSGEEIDVGLVAMHIAHKVSEATQWVWSTFEHVDNAPDMADDGSAMIQEGVNYSYFNKEKDNQATYNLPTDSSLYFDGTQRKPAQVVRLNKIEESTEKVNNYFQNTIKKFQPNSPWQYYKLVGTQWPFEFELFTPGGDYTPKLLANTVLETFIQNTSSCMDCHSQARFLYSDPASRGAGYNADFVWGLANAK